MTESTRSNLAVRLKLDDSERDSLLEAVRSRLDESITAILGSPGPENRD
jgi:hypothetical protein